VTPKKKVVTKKTDNKKSDKKSDKSSTSKKRKKDDGSGDDDDDGKRKKKKKKTNTGPKKAKSPYICFFTMEQGKYRTEHANEKQSEIMRALSAKWAAIKDTPAAAIYLNAAQEDRKRYEKECKDAGIKPKTKKDSTDKKSDQNNNNNNNDAPSSDKDKTTTSVVETNPPPLEDSPMINPPVTEVLAQA